MHWLGNYRNRWAMGGAWMMFVYWAGSLLGFLLFAFLMFVLWYDAPGVRLLSARSRGIQTGLASFILLVATLVSSSLFGDVGNDQLTRSRAHSLLTADLEAQGPIVYTLALRPTLEIRTPSRRPDIDLNDVVKRIEGYLLYNDVEYEKLTHPSDEGMAPGAPAVRFMREIWKTNKIASFKWATAGPKDGGARAFFGDYLLTPIAVLKPEYRKDCDARPYKEGDNACLIITAVRKIESVTGIREVGEYLIADYSLKITPTNAGLALNVRPTTMSSSATFAKYDDGWRLIQANTPAYQFR